MTIYINSAYTILSNAILSVVEKSQTTKLTSVHAILYITVEKCPYVVYGNTHQS